MSSESYQTPNFSSEVKTMPFIDKLVGIFSSPGEVYENVVKAPKAMIDWLIPMLILIVISAITVFLKFENETIRNSLIQLQGQRIEQLVEEGKMTEEQAGIAIERIESFGGTQKIFSMVGIFVGVPIMFLVVSLVYFFLGRLFFKVDVEFMTIFTIYSLSSLISSVGVIVSTILAFVTSSFFATASPAIFMEISMSKGYRLASKFEVFTLWQLAVFSVGMAKAFNKGYGSAFGLVFGAWAVWVVLSLFVPFLG